MLALAVPTATRAQAPQTPAVTLISRSLYPAHSHIVVMSAATNLQVDCAWGFVCEAGKPDMQQPRFHLSTEDALHRLSGWGQLAQGTLFGKPVYFSVFVSHYDAGDPDGLPWNVRAFMDFREALMLQGYQDLDPVPRLAPRGALANQGLQQLHARSGDVRAMTCWTGTIEAEGIAMYQHGSKPARQSATTYLTRQLRAAIQMALGAAQ
jgi:hypothetical protein